MSHYLSIQRSPTRGTSYIVRRSSDHQVVATFASKWQAMVFVAEKFEAEKEEEDAAQ